MQLSFVMISTCLFMKQSQSEDSASSYNMQAQLCQLYVNAQLTQNKHFAIKNWS